MIKTFVKNPVKVQAVHWTGNNFDEISSFTNGNIFQYYEKVVIKTHAGYRYIEKRRLDHSWCNRTIWSMQA